MRELPRLVSCAYVGISAIVMFAFFPYSPLQDLPEWIYQSYAFNELISGHASSGLFLKSYPVPYTLIQLLTSACLVFFNPMLTSKLIVAGYAVLSYWTSRRLIRRYEMDPLIAFPLLLSIFVLNGAFWSGYAGYQLGLNIFAFYLSLSSRWRTDVRLLAALSILAFFTHGIIYFTIILSAAVFSFFERRLISFGLASLPSALLALWYVHANSTSAVGGEPVILQNVGDFAAYKMYTFMKLGPYHNFIISGVPQSGRLYSIGAGLGLLTNLIFLLAVTFAVSTVVPWREHLKIIRTPELIIGLALVFSALLLSPTALGVGNPSERLLYPAFLALATVTFKLARPAAAIRRMAVARASILAVTMIGFALSSAGLILASIAYNSSFGKTSVSRESSVGKVNGRTLFSHRMVQFDDRIKETDREWRTKSPPMLPLAFDTALLAERR